MRHVLTLIAARPGGLDDSTVARAAAALDGSVGAPDWLAPGQACDVPFDGPADRDAVLAALGEAPVDVNWLPAANRRKRLLVADMEATVIANEMLDDLAALTGIGSKISDITARAMAGEIDFPAALRARVALLQGVETAVLDEAAQGIRIDTGAAALVATMRAHGATTVLVSGGFTYYAEGVAATLGFDAVRANELEIADGRLIGRVVEPVLGRDAKLAALNAYATANDITPDDALAVGDGANDLAMVDAAGLGVAFHAKPALADAADARIDHGDLTALLFLQGFRADEIVTPPDP